MNDRHKTLADWLAYIEQQHPSAIAMGLERVREVAARMNLGKPAKKRSAHKDGRCSCEGLARKTIVVAGTNGKGSTVAFIEAIARAAGWRTGAYTSPHLLRYNERVRIDGVEADDAQLVAGFEAVEAARAGTPLTYFEYGTLAALHLFQQSRLDLAVLEVGLGGRLDAVNIVDGDVAVITTVDIDHTEWLGLDRESIGEEKAGIIRAWKPLVLGEIDPPSSVLRHAYALGANAIRAGSDFFHEPVDAGHWRWRDVVLRMELPMPQLRGPVQLANAASAIAALRALGKPVPRHAWGEGVAAARLPGRLQVFDLDGVEVLVDVGHNPQAARELAAALKARPATGSTRAVYAALADKDVQGVARALAEVIDQWHLAGLEGARGQSAEQLGQRLQQVGIVAAASRDTVAAALRHALAQARAGDRVLVFGSFHTVAEALQVLRSGA